MKKYLKVSDQCTDEVDEVNTSAHAEPGKGSETVASEKSEDKDPIEGKSSSVQASTASFYDNDAARETFMSAIQDGIISEEEAINMLVEFIGTDTAIESLLYDVGADDIEDMFYANGLMDKLDQNE